MYRYRRMDTSEVINHTRGDHYNSTWYKYGIMEEDIASALVP